MSGNLIFFLCFLLFCYKFSFRFSEKKQTDFLSFFWRNERNISLFFWRGEIKLVKSQVGDVWSVWDVVERGMGI